MIAWLFWPSLVLLVYAVGAWLVARCWPAAALELVKLGDMAPGLPEADEEEPVSETPPTTTLTHEAIRRELVRLLSDETGEPLHLVDSVANFRTGRPLVDDRVLGCFYFRDRFITAELHPMAFALSIDEFSERYVHPAAWALAKFPRDGC